MCVPFVLAVATRKEAVLATLFKCFFGLFLASSRFALI
jgi:hypothetical protein